MEVPNTAPPGIQNKSKTWQTTITQVESWPEEARPLKRHDWITYLFTVGDIILVLLPVYFICMETLRLISGFRLLCQYLE